MLKGSLVCMWAHGVIGNEAAQVLQANASGILCCVGIMAKATKSLILELDARFPKQLVMDAMGIIYSQYWL